MSTALAPALTYPDTSVFGRLTDTAPALAMEIAVVRRLFRTIAAGRLRLLGSEVLLLEVAAAPERIRRRRMRILRRAVAAVPIAGTEDLARSLHGLGFHVRDALHGAAAYTGGAGYLVSCDDHFLRRAAQVAAALGPRPALCSPRTCLQQENLL